MMQRVPILPVRDVAAALKHYQRLGFEVQPYGKPGEANLEYRSMRWGTVELHLSLSPEQDLKRTVSSCYLYVDDADALGGAFLGTDDEAL